MNFTSQICTTKEQSERLLALGLKKETADCRHWAYTQDSRRNSIPKRNQIWHTRIGTEESVQVCGLMTATFIPAWSLHRLIEMMPSILHDLYELDFSKRGVFYADFSNGSYNFTQAFAKPDKTLYDNIIDCIEWLIKEGYFSKEYLEE